MKTDKKEKAQLSHVELLQAIRELYINISFVLKKINLLQQQNPTLPRLISPDLFIKAGLLLRNSEDFLPKIDWLYNNLEAMKSISVTVDTELKQIEKFVNQPKLVELGTEAIKRVTQVQQLWLDMKHTVVDSSLRANIESLMSNLNGGLLQLTEQVAAGNLDVVNQLMLNLKSQELIIRYQIQTIKTQPVLGHPIETEVSQGNLMRFFGH